MWAFKLSGLGFQDFGFNVMDCGVLGCRGLGLRA